MAEKDLRKEQPGQEETCFTEDQPHGHEYQIIDKSEAETQTLSDGGAQTLVSAANVADPSGHQRAPKPAGFIMRFGRGVKSAVGGAVNMIMQTGSSATEIQNSFTGACERATKLLMKLHSKHGEDVVPDSIKKAMMKTNEVVEQKDICISVFGSHNCGKSTLLNAFIGEELLPVYQMNETSVKIKVQHDSSIHQGVCTEHCPHLHGHSMQQSKSCPKLQITKPNNKQEIRGADKIYNYLSDLNKKVREQTLREREPPTVILKANIPLLAGKVPPRWTVSLVDNPGFGEAKEHVVQLADASLRTSSAYIYLLQTEHIGGTEAAEFFKELLRKDKTAMRDGRLAVAITKFDTNYNSSTSKRRGRKSAHTAADEVRRNTIASIKDATEIDVSPDTIIPLCGEWALCASRLANCLISDPDKEIEERQDDAAKALEKYPHLSLAGGQEQTYAQTIKNLSHADLVMHLENASGITDLKARIHYVVGKACVKVWATKILAEFQNYLSTAENCIISKSKVLVDRYVEKAGDHGTSKDTYDEIMVKKESIKATAPKAKKKRKTTQIWKEFEDSYLMDLNVSEKVDKKPQEEGKAKVRDLVKEFKEQCQQQISTKRFGPEEFEKSMHAFLDESAPKLQKVFDASCGFWNVQSVLMRHVEDMVESVTVIRSEARRLCRMGAMNVMDKHRRGTQLENRALKRAPNLGEIKLRVRIPDVSDLRWWEKVLKFFRTLRVKRIDSEASCEQPSSESGCSDNHSSATNSLYEQPATVVEGIQDLDQDNDTDSESDDDDDDNSCYSKDPVELGNVSLEEKSLGAASSVSASNEVEKSSLNKSFSSINLSEDETDGLNDQKSPTTTIYRKWNKELDEAIEALQLNMEMECDNYFNVIKPIAIKFFYKDYRRKTQDRLDAFEKDFSGHLEEENKRLKKLSGEMEALQKEYNELEKRKTDVIYLQEYMLQMYSLEFSRFQ